MRFGIIGAGMIARFHAEAIKQLDGCELAAVYARRPEIAKSYAVEFGCKGFSDLDELLADESIDIVTITTPSGAHLEPAVAAARAGKHVICEKPLEVNVERIDQMIAACTAAGVTLSGVFNRRFHPAMRLLKAAAVAGRFGRITLCDASVPWYRDQAYYDSGAWRGTWSLDGGGALMNQAIHTIDQLIFIAGDVRSVHASTACLAHERIEVEDTAVAILEFKNGALGTIRASTAAWSESGNPAEVSICGTDGTVILSDERFRRWEFRDKTTHAAMDVEAARYLSASSQEGVGANDPSAINCEGHVANFQDVVSAIQDGRKPLVNGAEARRSVAVIRAIYESAAGGGERTVVGGQ
jgi:predicted dehydrogenase